jgi:AraC-like DNA-binding protein
MQCKEFIELHYMENISVKQVAAFAGLHWAYFSKVFHEHVGTPPGQYVRMLRMNKAAELLAHSAMSVSEIASSLGFLDLYSFSRAFRNYYRVSPSFFRKQPFS